MLIVLRQRDIKYQPVQSSQLPTFRYVNFKVYDPVYIGIDKGFYRARGLEVVIVGDVLGGPTAIQAVSSGAADGGLSSVPALINANQAGLPVQGVVDIQTTISDTVRGQALQRWFVQMDSPIQHLTDLQPGTKYAINLVKSSFHYTSLMAMEQAGIDPETIEFVLLPFDKQIIALEQGEVDVIGLMEPYQNYVRQKYADKFRELFNDRDDVFHGSRHVSLIFVNRIWAQNNPEAAKAFVLGTVDAINWIETHQEEAKQIVSKYTSIPVESVPVYHFTRDGIVVMEDIEFWMEFMKRQGDLKADWVRAEDIATNAYRP